MAKTMNLKLAKLFLLGCANAAIITAMPQIAIADIPLADVLAQRGNFNRLPKFERLEQIQKYLTQDGLTVMQRTKLQNIQGTLNLDSQNNAISPVRQQGNLILDRADNTVRIGVLDDEDIANALFKTGNAKLSNLKEAAQISVHQEVLQNVSNPLEQLGYIHAAGQNMSDQYKQQVVTKFFNDAFVIEVDKSKVKSNVEHLLFSTNITDTNIGKEKYKADFSKAGNSDLLKVIKSNSTVDQKEVLLEEFKQYVKNNFVEINLKGSIDSLKTVLPLANSKVIEDYAQTITDIKTQKINLATANILLKNKNLISRDLDEKELQTLVNGFNSRVYNELMGIVVDKIKTDDVRKDKKENKKLVGLDNGVQVQQNNGVPPPPPPPPPPGRARGVGVPPPALGATNQAEVNKHVNINALKNGLRNFLYEKGQELIKFEEDNRGRRELPPANNPVIEAVEVGGNLTEEGGVYQAYYILKNPSAGTNPDLRRDGQNKLISAAEDLKSVIRIRATEIFENANENLTPKQVVELFTTDSINKEALKNNAKEIYAKLKEDEHVKSILANAPNKNIGNEDFFESLFKEEKETALERMAFFNKTHIVQDPINADLEMEVKVQIGNEVFAQNLINYVAAEQNKSRREAELKDKKQIIERINFISTHAAVFDEKNEQGNIIETAVNKEIKNIINNFEEISTADKIDLLVSRNNVDNNIAKADEPTRNTLQIKLKEWVNNNIVQLQVQNNFGTGVNADYLNKITAIADYELIKNYFEELIAAKKQILETAKIAGKVTTKIEEKDITNDISNAINDLMPEGKKLSKKQIAQLIEVGTSKVTGVLKEKKDQNTVRPIVVANANIGTPPPPPPPGGAVGVPLPPPPRGVARAEANKFIANFNSIPNSTDFLRQADALLALEKEREKTIKDNRAASNGNNNVVVAATSNLGKKYEKLIKEKYNKEDFATKIKVKNEGSKLFNNLLLEELAEKLEEKHQNLNSDVKLNILKEALNVEVGPLRNKESYELRKERTNLLVELAQDEGFLEIYEKYNPEGLKAIDEVTDIRIQNNLRKKVEKEAKKAEELNGLEEQRKLDIENEVHFSDVANMFENAEKIVEINETARVQAADRAKKREQIRQRIQAGLEEEQNRDNMENNADMPVANGNAENVDPQLEILLEVGGEPEVALNNAPAENGVAQAEINGEPEVNNEVENNQARGEEENNAAAPAPTENNSSFKPEDKENLNSEDVTKETELAVIEEAKLVEEAKRAEEVRIAEAIRVEALEVATMQTALEEDKEVIAAIYSPAHNIHYINDDIIFNRMKSTTLSMAAIAAGDEDEKVLKKGIWISGTYGTNKQGSQKGFAGYKGKVSGGTIGFDIGSDNNQDLVGIAYTKLDSKFKSSGNKLNTNIDSHIVSLYVQKELPKNFMIQSMFAYNHNIIKSKINRLGTIASGKYKNDSYNFEGLLNYNYLTGNKISITPNIGVRYGHIKDGTYQENSAGIQHLSVASKKQHVLTGIIGGSVALAPQKIIGGVSITPALTGSVENYFNTKSKKLDTKAKWKNREVTETVALPKQPKIGYNIGASVLTEKDNVSVVLEYNCHLQKKYQSHQGFVKLKVKF